MHGYGQGYYTATKPGQLSTQSGCGQPPDGRRPVASRHSPICLHGEGDRVNLRFQPLKGQARERGSLYKGVSTADLRDLGTLGLLGAQ